jgi:putative ABC transport system substrate-binding protein
VRSRGVTAVSLTLALGLLVAPAAGEAQQATKTARVGYLSRLPGPSSRSEAFRQGLRDLGYVEGKSIAIEYRWGQGSVERLRDLAVELVRLKVNVIVTVGPQSTRVARKVTGSIPIVMASSSDPVREGFVASLARPGGNITGLSALTLVLVRADKVIR